MRAKAGLMVYSDISVDFGQLTHKLFELAEAAGVQFLFNFKVQKIQKLSEHFLLHKAGSNESVKVKTLVNCAGGRALDTAQQNKLALDHSEMFFRGEYRLVNAALHNKNQVNIYTCPKHPAYPFLDPHLICRSDGSQLLGPTAVPVASANSYQGLFDKAWISQALKSPLSPKLKTVLSKSFVSLATGEFASVVSESAFVKRVQDFLPYIQAKDLKPAPARSGVRASLIAPQGGFVAEPKLLCSPNRIDVLNFNSPGATAAAAFAQLLSQKLTDQGYLDNLAKDGKGIRLWPEVIQKSLTERGRHLI